MSHWAEIDENNIVVRVLVGDNNEADEGDLAGVTRLVNGPALANYEDRKQWLLKASKIWPD
jgi:predicted chitinase